MERRRSDLDTWHLRPDCLRWPAGGREYDALARDGWTPASGHSSVAITLDLNSHSVPAMQADAASKIGALVLAR